MILNKAKILCVDDDPVSRRLIQDVLLPNGCEVLEAATGEEALEIIARENIDLVFLDIVMPGKDGYEVCRAIKGGERTRSIPVVMITALLSKEDRIKGIEAGAEEFLTKPFDPAEVLARLRMLLKAKRMNEMRTGEILIELGLISDQQLQEALKIAKEKNLKVGDALYSMGALSRDTIYWGLSNQLEMTYIELSADMVDKDLIQEFSIDVLKRLQCLPLYETNAEIHFAIADPTDKANVEAIKSLKPGKMIQLHLGLPEKIVDVLSTYERPISPQPPVSGEPTFQRWPPAFLPDGMLEPLEISESWKSWENLAAALLETTPEAVTWLYKTPWECRLLAKRESAFEVLREYKAEVYSWLLKKTRAHVPSDSMRGETIMVLSDRFKEGKAAFKIRLIGPADTDTGLARIERLPVFSAEAFERSHPLASRLVDEAKRIFDERRRLVVGGPDRCFLKQIGYSLLMRYSHAADFLPVFFLEKEADIYLPKAAQLSALKWDLATFLRSMGEEVSPFVFYEAGSHEGESVEACLSGFLSGRQNNVILCIPFPSAEAMRGALAGCEDRPQSGFRAVFIDEPRLEPVF